MPLLPARTLVAALSVGALLLGAAPAWSAEATWTAGAAPAAVVASSDGTDVLSAGERLTGGERLVSPDGRSTFVMQTDGNAVVYDYTGRATWSSRTQGVGDRLDMQTDGNVVVSAADGRPVWATGTDGEPGADLEMQDDGNLVVYRADGSPAWASSVDGRIAPPSDSVLRSGETLPAGRQLTSSDGASTAVMQRDGNVVVYVSGRAQWASGTSGPDNRLVMQQDGNAVVYSANGSPLWASGTAGSPGAKMVLQPGDLVVSTDRDTLWSSAAQIPRDRISGSGSLLAGSRLTSGDGRWRAVMQRDGNFVVYGPSGADWATMTSGSEPLFTMNSSGWLTVSVDTRVAWSAFPRTYFGIGQPYAEAPFTLVMQNDGNLVEYEGRNRPVWASRG